MNFAYSQAPISMKAVLQATLLMTSTFGNLIVIIISGSQLDDRVAEFFLFAGLMLVTMFVFMFMAYYYEYVDMVGPESAIELEDEEQKKQRNGDAHGVEANDKRGRPRSLSRISHQSVRSRARTNTSMYEYLGEATK